jgi:hypothetical protein
MRTDLAPSEKRLISRRPTMTVSVVNRHTASLRPDPVEILRKVLEKS